MRTYHLTIFPLAAWAKKQIDKIRRFFLWKGEENANGGHCIVNWPSISKPKALGGLGVPELDKFGRAPQLQWLWQEWTDPSKPRAGSELPYKPVDRLLFNASTIVTGGDGMKTKFWHHSWVDGEAPRNIVPHLFELARRKNRFVQQELHNHAWIWALRGRITTATHVEESISL